MRTTFAIASGLAAVASAGIVTYTETADVTVTSCAPTHTGNCPYKPESGHWEDWSSTPVDPTTTTSSTVHWEDWSSTTSSTPVKITSTSYDPSHTWADWTTSSTPVEITSTSYDPSHTWADWTTSTPVDPTATTYHTWGDWSSGSTPDDVTSCPAYTATAPPAWFSYLPSDVKSSISAQWTGAPPVDWCYYTYSTSTLAASTSTPVSPAEGTGAWTYSGSPVSPSIAAYTGAASSNAGNIVVAGLAAAAVLVIA